MQEGSDLESTIAELNGVTESLLATLEGAVARNLLLAQENATLADENARLASETIDVINAQLMLAYEELTSGRSCSEDYVFKLSVLPSACTPDLVSVI